MTSTPNPGSTAAIQQGCTCPVWDNFYGKGIPGTDPRLFIMTMDCPLHGIDTRIEVKDGQP
jgi:hypothetical protein